MVPLQERRRAAHARLRARRQRRLAVGGERGVDEALLAGGRVGRVLEVDVARDARRGGVLRVEVARRAREGDGRAVGARGEYGEARGRRRPPGSVGKASWLVFSATCGARGADLGRPARGSPVCRLRPPARHRLPLPTLPRDRKRRAGGALPPLPRAACLHCRTTTRATGAPGREVSAVRLPSDIGKTYQDDRRKSPSRDRTRRDAQGFGSKGSGDASPSSPRGEEHPFKGTGDRRFVTCVTLAASIRK